MGDIFTLQIRVIADVLTVPSPQEYRILGLQMASVHTDTLFTGQAKL